MSQWDQHTRFFSRDQVLKEINDLKFAIESLATLIPKGSFENENAKNAVTGLRARLDYLHRSIELLIPAPGAWEGMKHQIPKGPFEAQREAELPRGPFETEADKLRKGQNVWVQQMDDSVKSVGPVPPREGESVMAAAQRAIDASKRSDNA